MNPRAPRKLHRGHFAFMRALTQGLDERASWDRYLRLEGDHADLRTVRRTIAWIRDAFAAAARREQRPGTARLILLDPDRLRAAPTLPSLADFAAARGLEEFSEAEQIEAYQAAYPSAGAGGGRNQPSALAAGPASRRARVVERQLEALRWLEGLVANDPRPGDSVSAWLNPSVAARLEASGLATLFSLVERINGVGARWWVRVPGVGELKAARILEWLHANEDLLGGLRVGRHVAQARSQLSATVLAAVVPASTSLVPYEKFILPLELDGRAGRFRAPPDGCTLAAANDHEAIGAWLAAHAADGPARSLSSTQRSYRKEAERLLLWAVLERGTCLSSLDADDAGQYLQFLRDPPPAWCGPRHHQRWSPLWRPLEGPLAASALRQAMVILRGLFAFLMARGYLAANAFTAPALALAGRERRPLGASRTLSFAQWDHLDALLAGRTASEVDRRLARGMRWLYATGLRLAEITAARCKDLERAGAGSPHAWLLSVDGKGGRRRRIPVPAELVAEFEEELARHGCARDATAAAHRDIPLLARFGTEPGPPRPWSASGLYQAIKAFVAEAAQGLAGADAEQLAKASTHWLRHSHGTHALRGRQGRAALPIEVVQNNLGHASAATTSQYLAQALEPATR
ncbi:MAG TPA: phage integrase family protein [Variovorax sp.]